MSIVLDFGGVVGRGRKSKPGGSKSPKTEHRAQFRGLSRVVEGG